MFINSEDADILFAKLKQAEPCDVLSELGFLSSASQTDCIPLFEYDTDHNHAWYLIGLAYEKNNEFSEAAIAFKRAAEIWPKDTHAFLAYSNVEENLDAQIEFLAWGLRKNNDPQIRYNFSNALIDADRPAEAINVLETIESDVPFWKDVLHSISSARSMI